MLFNTTTAHWESMHLLEGEGQQPVEGCVLAAACLLPFPGRRQRGGGLQGRAPCEPVHSAAALLHDCRWAVRLAGGMRAARRGGGCCAPKACIAVAGSLPCGRSQQLCRRGWQAHHPCLATLERLAGGAGWRGGSLRSFAKLANQPLCVEKQGSKQNGKRCWFTPAAPPPAAPPPGCAR